MSNSQAELVQSTSHYLDMPHVLEIVAEDELLAHALLSMYLQASPDEIASLGRAIETGDQKDVVLRAHRIRGSLRYLGARDLEDMLYEIEAASGAGDQRELLAGYTLFQAAVRQLEQEIRSSLVSLSLPAVRS